MVTIPTGHSPLGGSGAPRWMKCPGSVSLSQGIVEDESDFATLGQAAHKLGELCLNLNTDAWSYIGVEMGADTAGGTILVDKDMSDAVQTYLDAVRLMHPVRDLGTNTWVEKKFYCPTIHEYFYGTSDFVHLMLKERVLHVWDYKHGAGVVVDVIRNAQGMYYACGVLEDLELWDKIDLIVVHIAQPRGFHFDGPLRYWTVSIDDLLAWMEDELVPAMDKALVSRDTISGLHCRFCPARSHACPRLMEDMEEFREMATKLAEKGADALTNEQVGRLLELRVLEKIVGKAAEKTAYERMMAGQLIPGQKLAKARSNREWKDGADTALRKKFGKRAMTDPKLKSPVEIEKMPEGEKLTARWAFKPDRGLAVVSGDDNRPGVNQNVRAMFTDQTKKGKK